MLAHIVSNSVELCKFIARLGLKLSQPQRRHVTNVADALIVSEAARKTLLVLHHEWLDPPSDQYALADCFRESPWTADQVRTRLLVYLVRLAVRLARLLRLEKIIFVSCDDSLCAKGPRKVARDILRRFFLKYHPLYLEMVAARRKAERDHARASEMLDELTIALDGHARVGSYRDTPRLGDRSYKAGTRWRADAPFLKLEVTACSGEIKIELERLPLDLAREVCALVRERLDTVAVDGS